MSSMLVSIREMLRVLKRKLKNLLQKRRLQNQSEKSRHTSFTFYTVLLLLLPVCVLAQVPNDGIPERAGTTTPTNITYLDSTGTITSEVFLAPDIIDDFGPISYIGGSPIDNARIIDALPTFGIAKWHWWLFGFVTLPRAQRQYATCIGEIRAYQKLLGVRPLLDDPGSPLYAVITSVREYFVPFEPIQQIEEEDIHLPPDLERAKAHVGAALFTHNLTVFHLGLCKQTASYFEGLARARLR